CEARLSGARPSGSAPGSAERLEKEDDVTRLGILMLGAVLATGAPAGAAEPAAPAPSPVASAAAPASRVSRGAALSAERDAQRERCFADLKKLCPEGETRQDRIRCIRKNRDNLPPSCVAARTARGTPIRKACAEDAKKLCAD